MLVHLESSASQIRATIPCISIVLPFLASFFNSLFRSLLLSFPVFLFQQNVCEKDATYSTLSDLRQENLDSFHFFAFLNVIIFDIEIFIRNHVFHILRKIANCFIKLSGTAYLKFVQLCWIIFNFFSTFNETHNKIINKFVLWQNDFY